MTQTEYIIPLTKSMKNLGLYRQLSPSSDSFKIKHSIPNMDESVSIRPALCITKKDIEQRYGNRPDKKVFGEVRDTFRQFAIKHKLCVYSLELPRQSSFI